MDSHGFILNLVIFLFAAVITVPIFTKLGLGSVLGYLVAGICIGPWGIGLIKNVSDILHFSEIGVVLLLFLIGLELEPKKLWGMRFSIIGAGGLQMGLTTLAIFAIAIQFGLSWKTALVVGLGLSLSSTAIALQTMTERRILTTPAGKNGFSILLFQDISVIPIIAIIPILAVESISKNTPPDQTNISALMIVSIIVGTFVVGRYALRHIFRIVASIHVPEIFTALSLLLVSGIAMIMNLIGVSMALGAFLAGVILADSEYRHALESDIQPFKGLLLGLFFISVGMSIDFGLLIQHPLLIVGLSLGLVCLKILVLLIVSVVMKIPKSQRNLFSFLLSQSGEFAFVLFGFAVTSYALGSNLADQLVLVVAMSMVLTPILMIVNDRYIEPHYIVTTDRPMDEITDENNNVILVGFGRFGQIIGRILNANKIRPTIIDHDPDHVERVRRFGYKIYYGDVMRHDVLRSVGAEKAKLIILTGAGAESINQAVALIQKEFPNLKIIARAYDRGHAMHLIDNNVTAVTRETFFSAVEMGKQTLQFLGFDSNRIDTITSTFVEHDLSTFSQQMENMHDEKMMISIAKNAREQIEQTLEADQQEEDSDETISSSTSK